MIDSVTDTHPADLVLTGGRVLTMDAANTTAQAVAVRAGRIVAVGSAAQVKPLIGPRTRRIELAGRTLLPGFQDAHVHPAMGGIGLLRCPLNDLPDDPAAYLDAIRGYGAAHPGLDWVLGAGWAMAAFPGGTPTRQQLDSAVPDRPAFFENRDGHGAWVNTKALALAGIQRNTPDPADGRIERDEHGEPAGTLHEGAMDLVFRHVPPASVEDLARGLGLAQAYLHSFGITAWQDAWVTRDDLAAYRLFAGSGGLTGRAIACQWWDRERGAEQIEELIEGRRTGALGRLRSTTVKVMLDGVIENFTAATLEPYLDGTGRPTTNRGLSFIDPELLKGYLTRLDREGFQVHMHALGDRAVREGLDALESARAANGRSHGRHHLAHLQLVDPADIPRFAALDATANIQPLWACHEPQMDELTIPFLGPARAALQYPFRSLAAAGARLAGGSDWSVSTPNVMAEVEVAVNRISPDDRAGQALLPAEALDLPSALRAFTVGSAWVNHLDDVTGSIEVGKLADLCVLDRDIAAPNVVNLGDTRVLLTLVEGTAVFEDPALEQG